MRFTELKTNIAGTSESEFEDLDVNKVDKALKSIGIQLKDSTGQIRDFDDVILELSASWDKLSRNEQRYIATTAAGSRQQSRLIALLDNHERLTELIDIAADSTGKADEQFAKYADTMEYKLNQLATKWEEFRTSFIDEKDFKKLIDTITNLLDKALNLNSRITPWVVPFAVLFAKTFVSTIFEQFQASRNNFAQLGTLAASGAVGQGASWISPSAQINKAVEKQNQKVLDQQGKISRLNQAIEQNEKYYLRKESAYKNSFAYRNVLLKAAGDIELPESQLKFSKEYIQNLKIKLKEVGYAEREIDDFFSGIKKGKGRTPWQMTEADKTAYYKKFLEPLHQEAEKKFSSVILQEEQASQASKTATQLKENKQQEEQKLARLQKEQERLQKIAPYGQVLDQGLVQGTVQGLQQVGSAVGMMASMMVAGAKATDTLNVGLTMLAMTGVSNLINTLSAIIPLIGAKNNLTSVENAITKTTNILLDNTSTVEAKLAAQEELLTLEKEKETAATTAQAAAQALATAAIMAAIVAIGFLIALGAKYIIQKNKDVRANKLLESSIGQNTKALSDNETALKAVSTQLEEYKQKLEDTRKEVDLFTEAEEYNTKAYLTADELTKRTELWNEIAEKYPELVKYYDQEGNAILEIGAAWDSVAKSAKEAYYEQQRGYSLAGVQASALTTENKIIKKQILNEILPLFNNEEFAQNFNINRNIKTANADILGNYLSKFGIDTSQGVGKEWWKGALLYGGGALAAAFSPILVPGTLVGVGIQQNMEWENEIDSIKSQLERVKEKYGDTSEEYQKYIQTVAIALGDKYDTDFKDKTNVLEIEELINEKIKSDSNFLSNWNNAMHELPTTLNKLRNEVNYSDQKYANEFNKNVQAYTKDLLKSGSDYYAGQDENIQQLMLGYITSTDITYKDLQDKWNSLSEKEKKGMTFSSFVAQEYYNLLGDPSVMEEVEKEFQTEFGPEVIAAYKEIVAQTEDIAEQGKALREIFPKVKNEKGNLVDSGIYRAWYASNQFKIQAAEEQAQALQQLISGPHMNFDEYGQLTEYTVNQSKIYAFYSELGEGAKEAFLSGLQTAKDNQIDISVAALSNQIVDIFNNLGVSASSGAADILLGYNWEELANATKESQLRSLSRQLTTADASIKDVADQLINDYLTAMEKAGRYNPMTNLAMESEAAVAAVENVNSILESNSDLISKLNQQNSTIVKVNAKEVEKIRKMFTDLSNLETGGIDPAQLNELLTATEEGFTFNVQGFVELMDEASKKAQEVLAANEKEKDSSKKLAQEEINNLQSVIAAYDIYIGRIQTVADYLDKTSSMVSSYTSAVKEQIDQGYLSSDSIKSLYDAFTSLGLQQGFDENHGFVNDKLELDKEALHSYLQEQFEELRVSGKLANATEEERLVWMALMKEFELTTRELETEASSTDKVADAWKDYANQADVVKEKQQSLNEKIDDYNKLLYGDENRKSGLDLLYNYNEAISSFNDEMSRSKDQLSDSQTTDEAINAFTRYSAATHNLLVEEKAKQEEIQRGLNEYGNMIQNGYASYTDQLTGRTIGINFGDYVKYDQTTGKYFLNQTLLDRAKFNDEYKSLIEENVENYNKYADEYKKSQDNVLKAEKEFQEQRKEAIKSYANFESTIADALKSQYEEEVNNLKDKYDAMKEEDDDYVDALKEAIDKQRKLRDRESKFEDLAKKERKLSLISRDTSGANAIQQRQLEEEIQKDRQQMLDDAIDDIIDGIEKLSTEQEETREVEIELKEALLENTAYWNNLAQETGKQITSQEEFITLMTTISKDFTELTYVQQLEKIEEYKETFAAAAQYIAMQQMNNASQTGDFIKDTIETTGDEILTVMTNTTSALANEAVRAYDETKQKVSEDLEAAKKNIDEAKQALKEAIEKLEEYAKKARDLEYARDYSGNSDLGGQQYSEQQYKDLQQAALEGAGLNDQGNQGEIIPSTREEYYKQTRLRKAAEALGFDTSNFKYADKNNFIQAFQRNSNFNAEQVKTAIEILAPDDYDKIKGYYKIASPSVLPNLRQAFLTALSRYANGGLVNFTGPAWVDGTPDKPEAFLNPEDTKRIGEAAKILSNLPIFNSSGEATNTITNNGGDISIEINLNVDKLSSDLDVDEMLNRVKEEIVAVARPAGVNTILTQHP